MDIYQRIVVHPTPQITGNGWPELDWEDWHETAEALHLWFQVVGKIRMALSPPINHWWHVPLYLTCWGLTTSPMPYGDRANRMVQIDFNFLNHHLFFQASSGEQSMFRLKPMPVAEFYSRVMGALDMLGMPVNINTIPSELPNPIQFDDDYRHAAYDPEAVWRFWQILLQAQRVFEIFRARFTGKVSPVHFFWGAPDLAVTRFSGRPAPAHDSVPNVPDNVVREAYSHEVSSCGFWPGNAAFPEAVFYSYAYPAPSGFSDAVVQPSEAYYNEALGEFVLPYKNVCRAVDPDEYLLSFLQSTYKAAAELGQWDRRALEVRGSQRQSRPSS